MVVLVAASACGRIGFDAHGDGGHTDTAADAYTGCPVIAAAAGREHACAIDAKGQVWCFGHRRRAGSVRRRSTRVTPRSCRFRWRRRRSQQVATSRARASSTGPCSAGATDRLASTATAVPFLVGHGGLRPWKPPSIPQSARTPHVSCARAITPSSARRRCVVSVRPDKMTQLISPRLFQARQVPRRWCWTSKRLWLLANGTLECWGRNSAGQLATNDRVDRFGASPGCRATAMLMSVAAAKHLRR